MNTTQMTFSDIEQSRRKKNTRRETFLRRMNGLVPWQECLAMLRPYYPEGKRGRPPRRIEVMLRMYLLQTWYDLNDEALVDAIYDSYAFRNFMGINFLEELVPDMSTLRKFKRMLSEHQLDETLDKKIDDVLSARGLILRQGSMVGASLARGGAAARAEKKARSASGTPGQQAKTADQAD